MKFLYYLFIYRYFKDNFSRTFLSIAAISLGIALFVSTQINAWRAEQSVLDQMLGYSSEKFIGRYVANNQNQGADDHFLKEIDQQNLENVKLEPEFQKRGTIHLNEEQILSFPVIGKDILLTFPASLRKEENKKIPKYFFSQSLFEKFQLQQKTPKFFICEKEVSITREDFDLIPIDGIFLVMDITKLQSICNQKNQITSIWLIQEENEIEPKTINKINSSDWTYEPKEQILERAGIALGSLKINLTIVSLVSVLISFFMVSNMFTGLYLARKHEFGILLSIGSDKINNFILFLSQSIVIGVLGGILGISLGVFIANTNLFTTVNTITDSEQIRSYRNIPFFIIASGFLISIVGSVLASIFNSYKTYKILPIDLIRERDVSKTDFFFGFTNKKTLFLSILFILLGVTLGLLSFAKQILPGMIGVGFVILGFVALNFLAIPYFVQILDDYFSKFHFPQTIKIGLKEIQMEPWKHGLTCSTIMLSTSLVFTLTSLTSSYERSLIHWVDEENKSDYSLINEKKLNSGEPGVPIVLFETLKTVPEFSTVEPFYIDSKFIVNGKYYTLHVLNFKSGYDKNQLIVSKNLCFLDRICKGSSITISTELNSKLSIYIQDEKDHFFSERGTIMMDYSFFQKNFFIKYLNSIRITKNKKITEKQTLNILQDIAKTNGLKLINQTELKKLYLEGMNQVFSILDTLKISALFISLLALTTSLIYFIKEKSQMLAGLKAIGMDSYQMFQLIYSQTLFLISFGILSGIVSSIILSPIVIFGINRNAFGWILDFQYPTALVVKLPILIPVITFFICLLPFYFLKKMRISKELQYE
ncbi:ABC transporter permease [Leptospira sp. 2 VSF19]|uniref:ABC transporter permease n=1 Tax=Leptospira soteropolitanensis TaxID=2950025 RepID=A0AAW5VNP6_9LEPT|nr:ABC transporter permease [Leptospira soteropolitanensis]MCW7493650.1 ABC transporter permease [Leptospira soteropolitanensis]MCW7501248.1 ABC transporter permease [Leptospira soteropolitanensis]MCW7523566.1 ABC transporter permease [Leptospira soteropolitanensis]MCW7527362.1 ABC transporter permease [Leptospira soteropolitanensis]MCW7531218.1 ABC transporter permease [Leptospira soteropolitanensis]